MARKKIVFVIVEGPSDEVALGVVLSKVYDSENVYVHIVHGDITTRNGVNGLNIVARVSDMVKDYAKSNHFSKTDFKQIIHIVDTDGVYISDDKIFEKEGLEKTLYMSDGIHTSDVEMIKYRNAQKRENLGRLRMRKTVWDIPYQVIYMSCNLDHVLYDKRNSTDDEKETDAYLFANKYKDDLDGFVKFICKSKFSVDGDYSDTWTFIERDMNSIERHTNIRICIEEAMFSKM